jgi:hypothetical protein
MFGPVLNESVQVPDEYETDENVEEVVVETAKMANHFLAHLALLVGPEALSRPATAQNSLGRKTEGNAVQDAPH